MIGNVDEEGFVRKLQQADDEVWREFVEHYVPRMLAYAVRHVESRSTAEDIVEDAAWIQLTLPVDGGITTK
jgi:DNA-directed RNA polymerase specialized sigma24 family protein